MNQNENLEEAHIQEHLPFPFFSVFEERVNSALGDEDVGRG